MPPPITTILMATPLWILPGTNATADSHRRLNGRTPGNFGCHHEGTMIEGLWNDFRTACRGLRHARSAAAAAVLILALGIAGTTVMFALIRGVLLRPLPVQEPGRLIVGWKELPAAAGERFPFGDVEIESIAKASQLLENAAGVARHGASRAVLRDNGISTYANVALITGRFFPVLGVDAVLGRALTSHDDDAGAENVIAISNGLWRRRWGGSKDVIGRRVMLGEQRFSIVGVMPPDLDYPAGVEIWRTTSTVPSVEPFADAARRELNLIGRLRAGVTIEQSSSEMEALTKQLDSEAPANALRGLVPVTRSFADEITGEVRVPLLALFAAVCLVLLIAVANVANLLLLRGEARRGELALRAAVGASPGRLVSGVVFESLMLSMLGGAAGFAVASLLLPTLVRVVPGGLPRTESIHIDATVALFAITVVFVIALAASLAPALVSMRADVVAQLRREAHVVATGSARGRRALVVGQVALAVTVVAGAGLLVRSMVRLKSVDLGLHADRVVLLELHLPPVRYAGGPAHEQFLDDAIARLQAVPAIASVTPVNVSPFSGQGWDLPRFAAEGQSVAQATENPSLNLESIHPNYFETLEVPLVRGRAFTSADRDGAPHVAIVSEDLPSRLWPGQDPIGKRLKMGEMGSPSPWSFTVIGVAGQTRYRAVAGPRPTLYLPAAQFQMTATMLIVRTTAPVELLAPIARDTIRSIDPAAQIMRIAPFAELLDRPLARPRFNAYVLSAFGAAALLLAMVGLYAAMAAYVGQRDREIAVRLALGASPSGVRRFVVSEVLRLTVLGVGIGSVGAASGGRLVQGLLYEVGPYDPPTFAAATILLIVAAAAASYAPVRRATRVEPAIRLRG
jgi:predicted permease